jgi:hypothetical protein
MKLTEYVGKLGGELKQADTTDPIGRSYGCFIAIISKNWTLLRKVGLVLMM